MRRAFWTEWDTDDNHEVTIKGYFHDFFPQTKANGEQRPIAVCERADGSVVFLDPELNKLNLFEKVSK